MTQSNLRPKQKSFLNTTKLPPTIKRFNSGTYDGGNILKMQQYPQVHTPMSHMSPAMKSQGDDNRSLRILSLIDGHGFNEPDPSNKKSSADPEE